MERQLTLPIRNAGLYSALRHWVTDAFDLLREDRSAGADVAFSVSEHRQVRDDRPFYEYRPMTERFVLERMGRISKLQSTDDAAWAVASDPATSQWLRAGRCDATADLEQVARDEVLVPLLVALAELSPDFTFEEEALLARYQRLEDALYATERRYVAIAPLWGVQLIYGDLQLSGGVSIRQVDPASMRMEWPEAAQLNWGDRARDGLPPVVVQFERSVSADDDDHAIDPRQALGQVVSVIRVLAGGSVCAGPFILERLDYATLAPRPVPAGAARPCGVHASRIDGTVARNLPVALRRHSSDPDGPLAHALERYELASTAYGNAALRAAFDTLVDIYSGQRETMSAALRMATVLGASLPERQAFVAAMRDAARIIESGSLPDEQSRGIARMLVAAVRATVAGGLIGELPLNRLCAYADSVLLGERERRSLGVSAVLDAPRA